MSKPGDDPSPGISSGDAGYGPGGIRHVGCAKLDQAFVWNVRTCTASHRSPSMGGVKGQATSGANREGESTDTQGRDGAARSSIEGPAMGLEPRGCVVRPWPWANWRQDDPMDEAKPLPRQRPNIGSRMNREVHVRLCVQRRLACSAGDKPAGVEVRAP